MAEKMDRGSDSLKAHVSDMKTAQMRQTRRGCFQEVLGCEAKTEFKYYKEEGGDVFATSLEDSDFFCRICCSAIRPFTVTVKESGTEAELFSVDRPLACGPAFCKCCCYQTMDVKSGGQSIGKIEEKYAYCVPQFLISDEKDKPIYKMHSPTCLGGMCVNCCAEGNPCGKGCCKVSFRLYPADQDDTDGDAPFVGVLLKKPKSALTEVFTDAVTLDVTFPEDATTDQKAIIMGAGLFMNALFFENDDQ